MLRVSDIKDGRVEAGNPLRISPLVESAYRRTRLTGGELLLTLVGTVGESAIVPPDLGGWNVARAVAVIPVRDEPGAAWVHCVLQTDRVGRLLKSRLNTTVQPTLNLGDVADIPIILPPIEVRRTILAVLTALDDKIELNRRMSQTLEEIARALFKSWFVDFDPVHAKAAGREPVGVDAETAALFPSEFEESELGLIPKGWEVVELRDLVGLRRESVNPTDFPEQAFEHFSIPAFDAGRGPSLEFGAAIKSGKYKVTWPNVLVSKLNPEIDRVWLPRSDVGRSAVCSTEFMVLQPILPVGPNYIYCLARSQPFRNLLASQVTGTSKSHQRAQPSSVLTMKVLRPPDKLVLSAESAFEALIRRREVAEKESATLRSTRDLLLPELVSGELVVG